MSLVERFKFSEPWRYMPGGEVEIGDESVYVEPYYFKHFGPPVLGVVAHIEADGTNWFVNTPSLKRYRTKAEKEAFQMTQVLAPRLRQGYN